MTNVLPSSTWSTLATGRLNMSENQLACLGVMLMVLPFGRRSVVIRHCLSLLRGAQRLVVMRVFPRRAVREFDPRLHPNRSLVCPEVRRGCNLRGRVHPVEAPIRVGAENAAAVGEEVRDRGVAAVDRGGSCGEAAHDTSEHLSPGVDRREGDAVRGSAAVVVARGLPAGAVTDGLRIAVHALVGERREPLAL